MGNEQGEGGSNVAEGGEGNTQGGGGDHPEATDGGGSEAGLGDVDKNKKRVVPMCQEVLRVRVKAWVVAVRVTKKVNKER